MLLEMFNVTAGESEVLQHIGASEVVITARKIVFLDTLGHGYHYNASRGAQATDIAVLVVMAEGR